MKIKLIANKESFGFKGKLWLPGEKIEVESGEIYPKEHFDVIHEHTEHKEAKVKKAK